VSERRKFAESFLNEPMPVASERTFCFGKFILDPRRGCLRAGDREVDLRPKSFEVLRYLVENAGRLVPKDEIIEAVWQNVTVTDESLTKCVSDIRLALEDTDQSVIRTMTRRGYVFEASVSIGNSRHVSDGFAARGHTKEASRPAENSMADASLS
jgi:DNA-binding winged helix-turn-helix (wHTH) protein